MTEDGKLTAEEKQKVVDWIEKHWPGGIRRCPICGNLQFVLGDHLVNQHVAAPGRLPMAGLPIYQYIILVCDNCGYTLFFNSVLIGLAKSFEKSRSEAVENG